ncbi:MAG: hypothetical protein HY392_00665 [Candidatus Diapherotrites archaeon]|nr:hypothetical protein [Candidatus Diapherotrites archaeon]
MGKDENSLSKSAEFFKNQLKLGPKQLSIEYMKSQDSKLYSLERLEEIEKNIRKAEFPVLVLGDNEKPGEPEEILEELQISIAELGFLCAIGTHIHELNKGGFETEIEQKMLETPCKLIVLISGQKPGTIGESKVISLKEEINNKTLFFFDYKGDYTRLVNFAKEKKFPVELKYPIPYSGQEELKAKVLFGVLHCFYRYYKYKRKEKNQENNNNENE